MTRLFVANILDLRDRIVYCLPATLCQWRRPRLVKSKAGKGEHPDLLRVIRVTALGAYAVGIVER
jgi:hypothetical protein